MTLHATVDVVVHLHRFRNIDLYARGVYAVRTSVYLDGVPVPGARSNSSVSTNSIKGIPYTFFSEAKSHSTFVRGKEILSSGTDQLPKAQVDDQESAFQSRAFVIKYRDEYLELNEGVQFQLLIPVGDSPDGSRRADWTASANGEKDLVLPDNLIVKIELVMSELEKAPAGKSAVASEKVPAQLKFQTVAEQEFVVSTDGAMSAHEYFPATFDDTHFCQLDVGVHTALMNLKFRRRAYRRAEDARKSMSQPPPGARGRRGQSAAPPQVLPNSFLELLFPGSLSGSPSKSITPEIMMQAQKLHAKYSKPMTTSIEAITSSFSWLWDDCLSPKYRALTDEELGFARNNNGASTSKSIFEAVGSTGSERSSREALPGAPERTNITTLLSTAVEDVLHDEKSPEQVVTGIIEQDVVQAAKYAFQVWSRFVALLPQAHEQVLEILKPRWKTQLREWWVSRCRVQHRRVQKILQGETAAEFASANAQLRSSQRDARPTMAVHDRNLLRQPNHLPVCMIYQYLSYTEMQRTQSLPPRSRAPSESSLSLLSNGSTPAAAPKEAARLQAAEMQPLPPSNLFQRLASWGPSSKSSLNGQVRDKSSLSRTISFLGPDAESSDPHLFVLHHGFHGSSYDLRLIRSYLLLFFPNAIVLSSQVNEENSDASIMTMGNRLAAEIRNFIMHKCPELASSDNGSRISFIGHSVGSVVIRAALMSPLLRIFTPKMHCFLSLSSPHLGNTYVPSAIVNAGMWALKRLRNAEVLDELQMLDSSSAEDTLIYRLSLDRSLSNFKHIILVSGHQDAYVPLHSALVQVPEAAERDVNGGPTVISMAANIMGSIDPSTVIRVNIDHHFENTTVDTAIGRAAHVSLLDSHGIIQLLFNSLFSYLQ